MDWTPMSSLPQMSSISHIYAQSTTIGSPLMLNSDTVHTTLQLVGTTIKVASTQTPYGTRQYPQHHRCFNSNAMPNILEATSSKLPKFQHYTENSRTHIKIVLIPILCTEYSSTHNITIYSVLTL